MIVEHVGAVLGAIVIAVVATRYVRHRAAHLEAEGRAKVALHVLRGSVPGLRRGWRIGVATLSPGRLDPASYVGGLPFLRRKPIEVAITGVDLDRSRMAAGFENVRLNPNYTIIVVESGDATLELAVPVPYRLSWVLDRMELS